MKSINQTARMAGFFYLMFIITSILADRFASIGFGDAAAIVNKMMDYESQFRTGFILGLLSALFFLLAAWALYVLLKPVNENLALLFLLLNLTGVAVQCFSMICLFGGFLLLGATNYLKIFPADQLQAGALFFANLYKNGFMVAQLFYGAWLLPLGYLVYKSGFLPRILGILLMVESFVWLMYPFQFFLFPSYGIISYLSFAVGFIGELSLTLWLLIMGARDQKPALVEVG